MKRVSMGTVTLAIAVILALTVIVPTRVAAQQQQNPLKAMKDAWKKARDQQKQQQQQQQNPSQQHAGQPAGPGPGQPPEAASGGQPGAAGPIAPPPGTKVNEQAMAPLQQGMQFYVSPHGVHVATFESSGSRVVIYYDGVAGPKFDEILGGQSNMPAEASIVFSPDGNHYAYCGRSGSEFVVMVDGKETARSSETQMGRFNGRSCMLGFTSNSQHFYYASDVIKSMSRGDSLTRFFFDGKPAVVSAAGLNSNGGLGGIHPAFSPDGNHYAYVATDPADEHRWALVVDGKVAPYKGGDPQWTADSQHLFTTIRVPLPTGRGEADEAMLDGRVFMKADLIQLYVAPAGDMVIGRVEAGAASGHAILFLTVGNKKIPGSEVNAVGEGIEQIVFSPDGKHFAAKYRNANNKQFVFLDGKKGMEYQNIDHLAFAADSSKVVYTAFANGKGFIVVGDQESDPCTSVTTDGPVIAPAGNRVGSICGSGTGGPPTLFMDGKTLALPSGVQSADSLHFTPDGQHYAYIANYRGMDRRLVIDGVAQQSSNMGNVSVGTRDYVFSPDSEHIAHYAFSPAQNGVYERGVFVDGKYVPSGQSPQGYRLTFTPDGKHILWAENVPGKDALRVLVDGKPVAETLSALNPNSNEAWWEMSADGTLNLLGQDNASIKRISITPSPNTSLDAFLAGGR